MTTFWLTKLQHFNHTIHCHLFFFSFKFVLFVHHFLFDMIYRNHFLSNPTPARHFPYSAFVSVVIISACGQLIRVICPCFVTVTGTRLRADWVTEGIEKIAFVITEFVLDT